MFAFQNFNLLNFVALYEIMFLCRYMKQQQRNVNENTDLNEDFNETDYDNYDHDPDRDRFVN